LNEVTENTKDVSPLSGTKNKNSTDGKKDVDVDRVFFTLGIGGNGERLDKLDQPVSNNGAENEMKLKKKTGNVGGRRSWYFSLEEAKRVESEQPTDDTEQV
jgi:hypothetical protein